jgi:hypothetical protein
MIELRTRMNQAPLGEVFEAHASKLDARLGIVAVIRAGPRLIARSAIIEKRIIAIGTAVA